MINQTANYTWRKYFEIEKKKKSTFLHFVYPTGQGDKHTLKCSPKALCENSLANGYGKSFHTQKEIYALLAVTKEHRIQPIGGL